MKKLLSFFALASFSTIYSQITITSNIPTNITAGAVIDAEVKINKGGIGNFAKYQMDAPSGYIVSGVEVKGGNFTFENQRAKIVWVSIPNEAEIILKLKIQATSSALSSGTFSQKFYYLENNEKKEVESTPIIINVTGGNVSPVINTPVETKPVETVVKEVVPAETKATETIATETKPVETKPVETKVVETVVTETKPVETKVAETIVPVSKPIETKPIDTKVAKEATPVAKAKVNSSTSESGTTYRVQLGLFAKDINKNKFPGAGTVKIETIDGLHRVTTGNFSTREEAEKFNSELQKKGYAGFVSKYVNGLRVK